MRFEGRVAIVTGAGRGLGRAHAHLLAQHGAAVVVCDNGCALDGTGTDAAVAAAVVAEIQSAGGEAVACTTGVDQVDGGAAAVGTAIERFGRVDIVVNNAGILQDKTFGKMEPDMIARVFDVHLTGAFRVCQAAWPLLREQSYGRIVNTSSTAGLFGNFGQANYSTAKMGLIGLTKTLAIEGERHGIKANAIAPGGVTRMTESLVAPGSESRLDPAKASPVVAWLAHEDCPVSGEVFICSGGRVARAFVGVTRGYFTEELTADLVHEHAEEIMSLEGMVVPGSIAEESALLRARFAP